MIDAIFLGETLLDFVPTEGKLPGRYEAHIGGAPCNVACGFVKLGMKGTMLSRVGKDPLGNSILKTLVETGVDISCIQIDEKRFTTVTIVMPPSETEDMLRYAIYNQDSADVNLDFEEIPEAIFKQAKLLHYGSLAMAREKSNVATLKSIERALANNMTTSVDVNLRPNSWNNQQTMIEEASRLIDLSKIVKLTKNEAKILDVSFDKLIDQGKILLVTDGANDAWIMTKDCKVSHGIPHVKPVDVTGGGDAFMSSFLYFFMKYYNVMDRQEFCNKAIRFCISASSYSVQNYGAIDSLPILDQVIQIMGNLD